MKRQAAKKAPKDKTQNEKASSKPTPSKWAEMNRKQRREMMRKMQSEDFDLEVVHPHAAGIDIGNECEVVSNVELTGKRPGNLNSVWIQLHI
jgi:hypothetical protein